MEPGTRLIIIIVYLQVTVLATLAMLLAASGGSACLTALLCLFVCNAVL